MQWQRMRVRGATWLSKGRWLACVNLIWPDNGHRLCLAVLQRSGVTATRNKYTGGLQLFPKLPQHVRKLVKCACSTVLHWVWITADAGTQEHRQKTSESAGWWNTQQLRAATSHGEENSVHVPRQC